LAEVDAATGLRHRRDVGVEQFGPRHPLAIGADADEIGILEVEHLARMLAVEPDRHQLLADPAAGEIEHALAVGTELRRLARACDAYRLAATRGHHVDALLAGPDPPGEAAAAAARVGDARAVGRVARAVVEAGLRAHRAIGAG